MKQLLIQCAVGLHLVQKCSFVIKSEFFLFQCFGIIAFVFYPLTCLQNVLEVVMVSNGN